MDLPKPTNTRAEPDAAESARPDANGVAAPADAPAHAGAAGASQAASLQAQVEHAASQLAFWRAMLARIQLDRRNLRLVLPVGLLLAGLGALACHDWRVGAGLGVLTVSVAAMGQYFTRVREQEYLYNLADAEGALARARQQGEQAQGENATPRT